MIYKGVLCYPFMLILPIV